MADKAIGELPAASGLYDDTLLVAENQGEAEKITGRQIARAVASQIIGEGGGGVITIKGEKGDPGDDGATFTPNVSDEGILSWTNDKGLPNPDPVNIKGPPGEGGGGEGNPDAVTTDGGGEIIMPSDFGAGPYEIEFTEEEDGGGSGETGGGVSSFNGRTGAVFPEYGDYTASMVNAVSTKLINTRKWTGTLADGVQKNISFKNAFNNGFTYSPILCFYLTVSPNSSSGILNIYHGGTTTIDFSVSGNIYYDYYMYVIKRAVTFSYVRINSAYNESEMWGGELGLELTGTTGTYEINALFLNVGEQDF